jgi:hypothetical protein
MEIVAPGSTGRMDDDRGYSGLCAGGPCRGFLVMWVGLGKTRLGVFRRGFRVEGGQGVSGFRFCVEILHLLGAGHRRTA